MQNKNLEWHERRQNKCMFFVILFKFF